MTTYSAWEKDCEDAKQLNININNNFSGNNININIVNRNADMAAKGLRPAVPAAAIQGLDQKLSIDQMLKPSQKLPGDQLVPKSGTFVHENRAQPVYIRYTHQNSSVLSLQTAARRPLDEFPQTLSRPAKSLGAGSPVAIVGHISYDNV